MTQQTQPPVPMDETRTQALKLLQTAHAIISPPDSWTQFALARTHQAGPSTEETGPDATCFCATGAVFRAAHNLKIPGLDPVFKLGMSALSLAIARKHQQAWTKGDDHFARVASWNDVGERTQGDVMEAFEAAQTLVLEVPRQERSPAFSRYRIPAAPAPGSSPSLGPGPSPLNPPAQNQEGDNLPK